MPPRPAGCSMTRLLSVIANCPSRKKPSRGVVAIQLGLPRPALRKADCVVREVFLASLISSSLISNGLRVSNFRRVMMSLMSLGLRLLIGFDSSFARRALGLALALPGVVDRLGKDTGELLGRVESHRVLGGDE